MECLCLRVQYTIDELKKFAPEILNCCKKSLQNEHQDLDFIRLNK